MSGSLPGRMRSAACSRRTFIAAGAGVAALGGSGRRTAQAAQVAGQPAQWSNGLPETPEYLPLAVWLQSPSNAARYKAAGINLYVGLWRGPTVDQLTTLKQAGVRVICDQNDVGLSHKEDPVIAGWMHGDEPDNAQPLPGGGYGGAIPPARIIADYLRMRRADPTRPILLNLGQGVANDEWIGRAARPEEYPEYCKGADILSFDVYPVAGIRKPDGENYLWYVPRGVERLRRWSNDRKIVWNCIECTHIENERKKATPHQVRAQVWMSLIHGSRGIIYFVHQFRPRFIEHALLEDPEMLAAVTALNARVTALAPVLNSPALPSAARVEVPDSAAPVALAAHRYRGDLYLFAVGMRNRDAGATFQVAGTSRPRRVEVLGENRTLEIRGGRFSDRFSPYDVHLYRIPEG